MHIPQEVGEAVLQSIIDAHTNVFVHLMQTSLDPIRLEHDFKAFIATLQETFLILGTKMSMNSVYKRLPSTNTWQKLYRTHYAKVSIPIPRETH